MSHAKQLHNRRYLNDYLKIINRQRPRQATSKVTCACRCPYYQSVAP